MLEEVCFIVAAPTVRGGYRNSPTGFRLFGVHWLHLIGDAKIEMTSVALKQGKEHRAYKEIKKKEIHIHTQKLKPYFTLIIPNRVKNPSLRARRNVCRWQAIKILPNKRKCLSITRLCIYFFILKLYTAAQFRTDRDGESNARLVLL